MRLNILISAFTFMWIVSSPVWSFTCYYTLAKDSCWTSYNVSVDIIDSVTEKKLLTVAIPAGKSWVRKTFECSIAQSLIYIAHFDPVIWESDQGKSYRGLKNWFLPATINPGDTAWTLSACYPADFSQVPLPPTAHGNCRCDFSTIPVIKPE